MLLTTAHTEGSVLILDTADKSSLEKSAFEAAHPSADSVSIQPLNTINRQGAEKQLLGLQARQIHLSHPIQSWFHIFFHHNTKKKRELAPARHHKNGA